MNPQLEKIFIELASKLGTNVEHLWMVLTKQAYINGVCELFGFAIWFTVLFWSWNNFLSLFTSGEALEFGYAIKFIFYIVLCFSLIVFLASISEIVSCLSNPEYWALKQILH